MYTLGLDTTSRKTRLAVLKKDQIIFDREWKSNANESETVIKTLKTVAESNPLFFQELKKIIAIQGPGSLNGTRVGITIANMLVWLTKSEVIPQETFSFWTRRLKKEEQKLKPHLMLKISEEEVYMDKKPTAFQEFLKDIKKRKNDFYAYGELTPTQHHALKLFEHFHWIDDINLKSLGQTLQEISLKGNKKIVTPLYAKLPKITPPKKKLRYV